LGLNAVHASAEAQHEHAKGRRQGPNVPKSIHRSGKSYWMGARDTKRFAVVTV
jgi:hypothetical protein